MTIITNTFDGGTHGAAMTTGNTGGDSGTPFTAVESAATFSNAQVHAGPLSMALATSGTSFGRWQVPGAANVQVRLALYRASEHTNDFGFYQTRNTTSSGTATIGPHVSGLGSLRLRANASATNVWTSASTVPIGQWVHVEVLAEQGTTVSDGRARIAYYLGDSETPVEDSGWIAGLNLRGDTGSTTQVYVGKTGSDASVAPWFLDTVTVRTAGDYTGDLLGPPTAAPAHRPFRYWTGSAYAPLDAYTWDGTTYRPLVTA